MRIFYFSLNYFGLEKCGQIPEGIPQICSGSIFSILHKLFPTPFIYDEEQIYVYLYSLDPLPDSFKL